MGRELFFDIYIFINIVSDNKTCHSGKKGNFTMSCNDNMLPYVYTDIHNIESLFGVCVNLNFICKYT